MESTFPTTSDSSSLLHSSSSIVSDCESVVSGNNTVLLQQQPQKNSFTALAEGEAVHDLLKTRFLRGLGSLGNKTEVIAIHRNACSDVVSKARLQSFHAYAGAVANLRGGDANVKYAWYGSRGEKDVRDILSHGFGYVHGNNLFLSPDDSPLKSVKRCVASEDGVRHLLLCRVILGRTEVVQSNTQQCEEYDSGVDSLSSPTEYTIWSNRMNTHVWPAYLLSFKIPSLEEPYRPTSPWMPFPALISLLSKVLPSSHVVLISKFYKAKIERKISRQELIQKVRKIAGDKLLMAAIKSYRAKVQKKDASSVQRSKIGNLRGSSCTSPDRRMISFM